MEEIILELTKLNIEIFKLDIPLKEKIRLRHMVYEIKRLERLRISGVSCFKNRRG